MKKYIIVAILILMVSLSGCGGKNQGTTAENQKPEVHEKIETPQMSQEEKRDGEPSGQRIVSLSPPIYSMLCAFQTEDSVVGVNPRTFNSANAEVVKTFNPQYKNIPTDFVGADFKVNKEALLSLEPDLILLYGKFQDEGLSELEIPVENLKKQTMNPEELTIFWEEELSRILNVENQGKIKKSWEETHRILENLNRDQGLRSLYIFSNMKSIQVSSANSYGNSFLQMVGIENIAKDVEGFTEGAGQVEISMEQINEWNPDIIFVGTGHSAREMLEGKIPNQDWSHVDAVKNKRVYDIPKGIYAWGMPCSDSPLVPHWMATCIDEEHFSKADFKVRVQNYYDYLYNVKLDKEVLDSIIQ